MTQRQPHHQKAQPSMREHSRKLSPWSSLPNLQAASLKTLLSPVTLSTFFYPLGGALQLSKHSQLPLLTHLIRFLSLTDSLLPLHPSSRKECINSEDMDTQQYAIDRGKTSTSKAKWFLLVIEPHVFFTERTGHL